jgi:predicted membrane chloride channel (bestrophin family)
MDEPSKIKWTPDYREMTDDELLGEMEAKRVELELLISKLESQQPPFFPSLYTLVLSTSLIILAMSFVIRPRPFLSSYVPIVASFLLVLLGFMAYSAYRRWSAHFERSRIVQSALQNARQLLSVTKDTIRDMQRERAI